MRDYSRACSQMVETQLIPRGITDERVLEAMRVIPRHLFVEEALQDQVYGDYPLPIGDKQTISQPFMVALMTEALELEGDEKILEVGTGSGYQTAILCKLADRVFSIERYASLASKARRLLDELNLYNLIIRVGDGTLGWVDEAPFDAIIVSASSPDIPEPLVRQLKTGGKLVIPAGGPFTQTLIKLVKEEDGITRNDLGGCRFVKLVGEYGWKE
ncbi:MAG: protein-L-isoaspartate(D-aspartate) O-methyltransferase [Thermodesulfobacteriota bacterium]